MITFEVTGIPVGQGVLRRNSHGATYEATKGHGAWRKAVVAAVRELVDDDAQMLTGPVSVTVIFTFPRPKSHYTSKGVVKTSAPLYKISRPDTDHLQRSIGDALTVSNLLHDDAQIAHWDATKLYGHRPSALVMVRELRSVA